MFNLNKAFDLILNWLHACGALDRRLVNVIDFGDGIVGRRDKLKVCLAWNWRISWKQSEMMLSVSPNCIVRSSLEEMLEALQRRDESEMPRDVPPALPRRAIARSRLPSAKRRLPVSSEADTTGESSEFCMRKVEMRGQNKIGAMEDFKQVQQGTPEEVHQNRQHLPELDRVVVTFQSYVRGEIARKEYRALLSLKEQDIPENNLGDPEMLSKVEELQKRVSIAEATLELKEKENASLREQVQQHMARWSEFEAKTKSNEETWQKQIASLQMELAAAQKSGVAESTIAQPEKNEGFNPVSNGVKARKVTFDEETRAVVEVDKSQYAAHVEKLRGLKRMIKAWTKGYKVRVRDSNTKVHSVGLNEAADRHWKTWWGKKSKRQ